MNFFERLRKKYSDAMYFKLDEVSSIKPDGRDGYRYREGDRELRFQADLLNGNPSTVIYRDTISSWLPPHENEIVTESDKDRIIDKITKHFEKVGVTYTIER